MNNIAPKLQNCWTQKIAFKIISKVLKQPNFFHSQPSTLPKDAPAKFYLSKTFALRFMISSAAPTRSSTFKAYLISKIGNSNVKDDRAFRLLYEELLQIFVLCIPQYLLSKKYLEKKWGLRKNLRESGDLSFEGSDREKCQF